MRRQVMRVAHGTGRGNRFNRGGRGVPRGGRRGSSQRLRQPRLTRRGSGPGGASGLAGLAGKEASRRRLRPWHWLLLGLVAVNGAVVWYHGDPRQLVPGGASAASVAAPVEPATEQAPILQPTSEEPGVVSGTDFNLPDVSENESTTVTDAGSLQWRQQPDVFVGLRMPGLVQRVETAKLRWGQTVGEVLANNGVDGVVAEGALAALRPIFDFRRLRPGDPLTLRFAKDGRLVSLDVMRSVFEQARASWSEPEGWQGAPIEVHVEHRPATVSGELETSLWDALVGAGEDPRLVHALVDIFAWEIDFFSEIHPGDTFRLMTEKKFVDGDFVEYGPIQAAEFVTQSQPHRAFLRVTESGAEQYFDAEGRSLRKQLLKTPLQYGRITSRFGRRRRHPVLGFTRAHNGVDYGVPAGTPVFSVGSGTVVRAGWHGGFGRLVEVRHANGWLSQYAHLSRILVRRGQRVEQKEVVGKVGMTGLATGPHLHYGLKRYGGYVNPLSQRFERGKSLAGEDLLQFKSRVAILETSLDQIRVARDDTLEDSAQPPSELEAASHHDGSDAGEDVSAPTVPVLGDSAVEG